jgi:type IV pilus assembly protein PilQ
MKKWTKTAGLLFMAASSVYYGQAVVAAPAKSAPVANGDKGATDVRLLEELAPAGSDSANTTTPATATTGATDSGAKAAPGSTAPPAPQGKSVSKSEVNVSDEGTVEIHVNDASLVEVLRMLSLQSQKNIICSKEVRGTVTANLYNVTIREALEQVLHMNGYAYREKGNFINVYTVKELQQIEDAEKRVTTEVFHLHYTPAANAINMIKPVLSAQGQASATTPAVSGIATGGADVGGNSHSVEDMLVITDYPDNLDKVRKILKELDQRPQQVMVEATILRAALTEDNALGVDFNVLAGVRFTDFTSTAGQLNGANINGPGANTGGSGGSSDGTSSSSTGAGVINHNGGSIGTGNSFTSSIPGGMKVGFVSDNVSVFLAALEGVTDTVVLANPKILALNKQKGEVIVGRKDGYLTTTVTSSASVQTVEFLDTGTRLIFRPYIAEDGYVRMELHPEDSSGGITSSNLPFKITTEMTSNIMVKDGHTIVIGGLFRESSDSARSQTPFLGNLPVAGALFRNQRDRTTREEIIILLTPHIIKDDEVFGRMSAEELKKADTYRFGVRKGMMPWGRERLAEGEYEAALAELKKPNPNNQKVLWHLDCATNLNPTFLEAMELKQKTTGREVSTSDNSSIRTFVQRMVLADTPGASAVPPTNRIEDKNSPAAKPSNPSADATDNTVEPTDESVADNDLTDETPLDEEDYEAQPEADQVVNAPAPTTQPSTPAVAESPKPTTAPVVADTREQAPATDADAKADDKKTADGGVAPTVTVTELPVEEVKPDAPTADDNK